MPKAIRIHANGGPELMRWEDFELPPPGAGEARLRHTAIGINYSDVNVRRGGFYLARPLATRSRTTPNAASCSSRPASSGGRCPAPGA